MLALPQDVMERVLRESLQRRFGVVVELGIELVSFEQSSEHVVAHLKKHTKEQSTPTEETVYAQYLVGTDGARSVVRKGLGLEFSGETRSKDCWIYGDVELTGLPEDVCRITHSTCTPSHMQRTGVADVWRHVNQDVSVSPAHATRDLLTVILTGSSSVRQSSPFPIAGPCLLPGRTTRTLTK
jgi:2-polyprenyl-6-methoxyphenol hydroxylase-like FAD-dependent oxidoreductase